MVQYNKPDWLIITRTTLLFHRCCAAWFCLLQRILS